MSRGVPDEEDGLVQAASDEKREAALQCISDDFIAKPLRSALLLPDKRLLPLIEESGRINPEIARLVSETTDSRR